MHPGSAPLRPGTQSLGDIPGGIAEGLSRASMHFLSLVLQYLYTSAQWVGALCWRLAVWPFLLAAHCTMGGTDDAPLGETGATHALMASGDAITARAKRQTGRGCP